jgi:hypothetical protein
MSERAGRPGVVAQLAVDEHDEVTLRERGRGRLDWKETRAGTVAVEDDEAVTAVRGYSAPSTSSTISGRGHFAGSCRGSPLASARTIACRITS